MPPAPTADPAEHAPRSRRALRTLADVFWARDRFVAALALALVVYYCATRGIYQGKASGDGFFGFMYLPAAVYHHSLDIGPTVPQWVPYLGREPTGHVPNACPIGPVLFWFPTYLIAIGLEHARDLVTHARPAALPGQTVFDFWMAGLGSLAAGIAGIALLFKLLRRRLGAPAARFGAATAVLATPLAWYLVIQPLYQHACAFFAVTLLVERWDAWRGEGPITPKRYAWLGAMGGLAMTMRLQEGIWLLLPGLDAAADLLRAIGHKAGDRRAPDYRLIVRTISGGVLLALCAAIAFSPQAALWRWLFGFLRPPQPPGHMRWLDPALVATVFSTRGGLLPWTPALYLLIPGLYLARRALGGLAFRLGLLFAIEVWVNASAWDHWGSWTFGARRFTDATVTFAVAFGGLYWFAINRPRNTVRNLLIALFTFFIAYNNYLMRLTWRQAIKSSGAGAFPFATWAEWAKEPPAIAHAFDRIGYPFVQPAGWIYSMVYHVPPRTFEGVVGNYFLDRDSRIHAVIHTPSLSFATPLEFVPEGIAGPPDQSGAVPVEKHVRVLVPLFTREPIAMKIVGEFNGREKEVRATWNDEPIAVIPRRNTVELDVPANLVHTRSRTNQLILDVPESTRLTRIDFESHGDWWK